MSACNLCSLSYLLDQPSFFFGFGELVDYHMAKRPRPDNPKHLRDHISALFEELETVKPHYSSSLFNLFNTLHLTNLSGYFLWILSLEAIISSTYRSYSWRSCYTHSTILFNMYRELILKSLTITYCVKLHNMLPSIPNYPALILALLKVVVKESMLHSRSHISASSFVQRCVGFGST